MRIKDSDIVVGDIIVLELFFYKYFIVEHVGGFIEKLGKVFYGLHYYGKILYSMNPTLVDDTAEVFRMEFEKI